MASSRTSFGLVVGSLVVVLVLGGILFAAGYFGERTEAPTAPVIHAGWKIASDGTITFKYPENIGTTYITAIDWPPQMQIVDGPLMCVEAGEVSASAGKTERLIINGREYCVTTEAEGAAGSTYLLKAYAFPIDAPSSESEKVIIFTFGLRETQCANYDDAQKTECEHEHEAFDISPLIDEMAQTIQFLANHSATL